MIDMYSSKEGIISSVLRDIERTEGSLNVLECLMTDIEEQIHDNWYELLNLHEFVIYCSLYMN